jgi:hypothetical protein
MGAPDPNTHASSDLHNEALRRAKKRLGKNAPFSSVLRLAAEIFDEINAGEDLRDKEGTDLRRGPGRV